MLNNSNIPPIEEVREIKSEIPSYEEFLRNYKMDERVSASYWAENETKARGYGPCYSCGNGDLTFELEIILKNSRGGRAQRTVYDIVDAFRAASEIERKEGYWSNGNPSFSSWERKTLVDRIINSIDEHVSDNRSIDRTVVNDIDDDDCTIL